ncbi:MAG TPA: EamA family transporter [Candidatus Dormibacteraeota bacterium]|nr:EamA family transporter [Candidatus Dormibacteraeota bacterium]
MSTTTLVTPKTVGTPAPLPHTPARTTTLVLMAFAAVYVVWGSTYLAIRIGIESFPPLILAGLRHITVGLFLYPILRRKTGIRPTAANWRTAVVTGALLLFAGNGGVSWAEQTVPSGIAALLVATVSLWLVIVDWLRPGGVKPAPRVAMGLLMGFAGLALLVGPAHLGGSERVDPRGAAVLVGASLAWACGSLYSKHGGMPSSPMLGVAMQSFAGGAILLVAGLFAGEFHALHLGAILLRSWLALAYLMVFGSGMGFSAYIYILHKSTAARVATYAFVNPVVALFLGWLIAGETITLRTVIAAAVILTAVILVITAPHPAPVTDPVPAPGEV